MSTFLVFGATGAVGGFLLPRLLARGDRVRAVSRRGAPAPAPAAEWIAGDLHGDVGLGAASAVDVVVSLGPLDAFAAWFERAELVGVTRVVALSSMSADSKRDSADAAERALSERLLAGEARLVQASAARRVGWTIFRPTLIYGNGRDRSLAPIARFVRRWRVLPLPLGADGLRQPVHAADLAAAVVAALDCPASAGRTYPLGGGERLTFNAMLRRLSAEVAGPVLTLPLPLPLLRLWARLRARAATGGVTDAALRRLREPLIADNAAAARDFGYAPRAFIGADVLPA